MRDEAGWLSTEGDINLSELRQQYMSEFSGEEARAWLELDSRYFLHQSLSTPCLDVLDHCDGPYIVTVSGRKILDFHGNNVHQVGFRHPKVMSAVVEQLGVLPFSTRRYTNRVAVRLAERLAQVAPGELNRVLFAPAATLAMGTALKLARFATGKYKTLSTWGSFHGASMDALSVGGEALFRRGLGPLLPGSEHVPACNPRDCPFRCGGTCSLQCAEYLEYVLQQDGEIGAVVLETVRNTDVAIPSEAYMRSVADACKRHGALLILDETAVALGRTGKMFAFEHYGIEPDMVIIGKGFAGGVIPFAAVLASEALNVATETSIGHYTYEKSPVGAAAALAVLDVIEDEKLCDRANELGDVMRHRLNQLRDRFDAVVDVRGVGALWGVELCQPGKIPNLAERVMYNALANGVNFKVSSSCVLTLSPALTIEMTELGRALDVIAEALTAALSQVGATAKEQS